MSGGITIDVTKTQVPGSTDWVYYKHSSGSGFTLGKITHSDVTMKSTDKVMKENMNKPIGSQGAIYVYYKTTNLNQPKVICISEDGTAAKSKWYVAVSSATNWKADTTNFDGKTPEGSGGDVVTQTQLDTATATSTLNVQGGPTYVIKLDKRPGTTGTIKYRTKDREITVEKTEHDSSNPAQSKVPQGYVRYAHTFSTINDPKFKHNGIQLAFDPPVTGTVEAVYVYYKDSTDDPNHQFPLIVCIKKDAQKRTYYTRGFSWSEDPSLKDVNPEDPNNPSGGLNKLRTKLDEVKVKFEIKLEKSNNDSPYFARPGNQEADKTTVSPVDQQGTPATYKGFKHTIPDISKNINRITIYNQVTEGIPQNDIKDFTFESGGGVFVYFPLDGSNRPELHKPLLICLSQDGIKSNSESTENNKWYKRNYDQNTGRNTWQDVTSNYGDIKPAEGNKIDSNLKEKLGEISTDLTNAKDEGYLKPVSVKLFINFNTWKRSTGAGRGGK